MAKQKNIFMVITKCLTVTYDQGMANAHFATAAQLAPAAAFITRGLHIVEMMIVVANSQFCDVLDRQWHDQIADIDRIKGAFPALPMASRVVHRASYSFDEIMGGIPKHHGTPMQFEDV